MTDWKQITARIRRARTAKDPAGQLSNLYQKTRDGMVAYELARHFEAAGQSAEAVKWYSTAAERFRRVDWKTKAQEAITRLGGSVQNQLPEPGVLSADQRAPSELTSSATPMAEPLLPFEQGAEIVAPGKAAEQRMVAQPERSLGPGGARKRRRGRRGGRKRRPGAPQNSHEAMTMSAVATVDRQAPPVTADEAGKSPFGAVAETLSLPSDHPEEGGAPSVRGRYGDPGLSSRLSLLEMQFRRLLSCPPLKLDEADRAPAGPGVFLLGDSDLTTHYYVEACQTLRIAVRNLLRGGSGRQDDNSIKPRLAKHLGIAESRVAKYLSEHCVVRWLQLDDDASYFAHFLIAVLRPSLNA
jgi:hypothetical protein